MTSPDSPTEALRTATRPLEQAPAGNGDPASCARCQGPVEPLSQGHYQSACRDLPALLTRYHFCCPPPAGCDLQGF